MNQDSLVYFIQQGDTGPIKIGVTINLYSRFASLQKKYQNVTLRILGIINGEREKERALHLRFRHIRLKGEWFNPTHELENYIKEHAKPIDIKYTSPSVKGIDFKSSYVGRILKTKGWDIRDFSYHAGVSQSICYQAMKLDWPFEGTNWKTIRAIARALGISPIDLLEDTSIPETEVA